MSRAAFLDRDGVINRKPPEGQYVTRWEEMHLLPEAAEGIALLNRAGFRVIVVTNQRCVAKGLIATAELESMHERMCRKLAADGATIDGVFYCPHEKQPACRCRKPAPGMLLDAARAHQIDLKTSWMIGDSEIDVEAGRNAECKTVLLSNRPTRNGNADLVAPSLLEAIHGILKHEGGEGDGQGSRQHQNQEASTPGSTERIKTAGVKHYGAAYPKVVAAVCISIVCVLLVAGLWPFHTPRNEVDWLRNENGLHFGRYGSAVSKAVFPGNTPKDGTGCSLAIWVAPSGIDEANTILAFDSSADPRKPFSLEQRGSDLVLKHFAVDPQGHPKKRTFEVAGVFHEGTRSFVTITSDGQNASVYVDDVLVKVSPTFGLSPRDLTGRLVLANSTTNDSWSGQVLGLATYHRQLTPPQVVEHYQSWIKSQRPSVAENEASTALYLFNERGGSIVHNQADAATDLVIPAQYFVLHPSFLSMPWREYYSGWGYWQDIGINIAGFIPFGFSVMAYLSLVRKHREPIANTIVLGFVVSLGIETLQGLLPTRSSGMTDVITNTLGTAIGVLLYHSSVVQGWWTRAGGYAVSFLENYAAGQTNPGVEAGSGV
jgi:D-glycero-D-manno-heptose 1,7-bisphosphate phosphatase